MEDPMQKLIATSATQLSGRPGRIFLIRVRIPSIGKVLTSAIEVEARFLESEKVKELMARDRMSEDDMYRAVAIDSLRLRLERSGFSSDQLEESKVMEVRQIDEPEMQRLIAEYAQKDGN